MKQFSFVELEEVHRKLQRYAPLLAQECQLRLNRLLRQTRLARIHWLHYFSVGPSYYLDQVQFRDFSGIVPFLYGSDSFGRWAVSTRVRIYSDTEVELGRSVLTVFQRYIDENTLFVCRGYRQALGNATSPLWSTLGLESTYVTVNAFTLLETLFRTGRLQSNGYIVQIY